MYKIIVDRIKCLDVLYTLYLDIIYDREDEYHQEVGK